MKAYLNPWDEPHIACNKILLKIPNYDIIECHFDFEGTPDTNKKFGMLYYDSSLLKKSEFPASEKQKALLKAKSKIPKKVIDKMTFDEATIEINEMYNKRK